MFAFASLLALLAASVSAMPNLSVRQSGASCTGLADGSTDSPSYNFTLAAYNTSSPNSNSTGAPLVLGWDPPGRAPRPANVRGMALERVAVLHSLGWCALPHPRPDEDGLGAYDFTVASGAEVAFFVTEHESDPEPALIYCAAADNESDYAKLAVNNDADSLSLCEATSSWGNIVLVYEASTNNSNYDYSTCYPVQVNIIPYEA
ncbi:uncharacterized protein B0H18DRAFT_1117524 [Fomitopsis serialis]|uniref:uncharacterized protein n=1 Tax=Fomitopsis serialis TaxID=139415 RepID=UPI0020088AE4|nr:uncharacterized protein B0H18DRAFT_1117524 [Neoantrodia serialis]KAH9929161.1 hypothetical protein B0H18DRAFT_1117524 [Neoantrodia serialis]